MAFLELRRHRARLAPESAVANDKIRVDALDGLACLGGELQDGRAKVLLRLRVPVILAEYTGTGLREQDGVKVHRFEEALGVRVAPLEPLVEGEERIAQVFDRHKANSVVGQLDGAAVQRTFRLWDSTAQAVPRITDWHVGSRRPAAQTL